VLTALALGGADSARRRAALALTNLRLREALHSQSVVDPLTGLFNRRYLERALERECRRAMRSARPLSVPMLDGDPGRESGARVESREPRGRAPDQAERPDWTDCSSDENLMGNSCRWF
jgi:hypothetical protein